MQIKGADGREADLATLGRLLDRRDVVGDTRQRIEREIRQIRAGIAGERDAAYEIEFHFGALEKRATIHDLRLEIDGRVAQIDHIIIDRLLTIWVCESKHFAEGVGVDERGEWVRWWGGRPRGIPSPVEQNRRHIVVLRDVFDRGIVQLPKRLGLTVKPVLRSVVLVSNNARISRPRSKAAATAVGADEVIKVERLAAFLEADREAVSVADVRRLVSSETVQRIGRELAALHRPAGPIDWEARFGLAPVARSASDGPSSDDAIRPHQGDGMASPAPPAATLGSTSAAKSGRGRDSGRTCAVCGIAVSVGVARYAEEHADRFGGRVLCMDCQHRVTAG